MTARVKPSFSEMADPIRPSIASKKRSATASNEAGTRAGSAMEQQSHPSAPSKNDEDHLLYHMERKAIQLEAELKQVQLEIQRLRSKKKRRTDNDAGNSAPIQTVDGNCLVHIIRFLDPSSAARCEMTSTRMKKATQSAWPGIEDTLCPVKEHRSKAKSTKERCVRYYIASKLAREAESNVMRGKGRNRYRGKLYSHMSYLPSHGYIGQEGHYETFVRFGDGDKYYGHKMGSNGPDINVLSQGFNDSWKQWTNQFYRREIEFEHVFMDLGINLCAHKNVFPHMPDDFCSLEEECVYHPEFDDMQNFLHYVLVTIVAVHKETQKAYLLYATWGFEEDKGFDVDSYCFAGRCMKTERGSEERCCAFLEADVSKDFDEDHTSHFRLRLEYCCPREEYTYGTRRYKDRYCNRERETATFTKRISRGLRINADYLVEDDLEDKLECQGDIPLEQAFESVGNTFDVR